MLRLTSNITIGKFRYTGVVDLNIESSWDTLTDTCDLVFPRKVSWQDQDITEIIKKGDPITVEIGYDDQNHIAFMGFVTKIRADIPLEVECEDHAWLLKQNTITNSFQRPELAELLQDAVSAHVPVAAQPDSLRLGPFRYTNVTPAKILDTIKKDYFQKFWFRNGELYGGLAYWPQTRSNANIRFERNVVDHDLEFRQAEDIKIKLKVVSIGPDNKKEEYEFGDPEGEQRTIHYYDMSAAAIRKIADEEIDRLKYTGYRGTLTTFGKPFVQHGDVVNLTSEKYPERDGSYLIKSVNYSFGQSGYRQELELDQRIA